MKNKILFLLIAVCVAGSLFASCNNKNWNCKVDGHKYELVESESILATCTREGVEVYRCSECGKTKTEYVKKLNHDFGPWKQIQEPGCNQDGIKERECKHCHRKEKDYIRSLPHNYELLEEKSATCTEQGYKIYYCTECGYTYTVYDDVLGHIPENEVKRQDPTCTESGYVIYHCSRCNKDYKKTLEPTGHNFVKDKSVEPSCNNFGYDIYKCKNKNCIEQKHVYKAQKKEHDFDENGICRECGKKVTETMILNTHDESDFSFVEHSEEFGYLVHAKDRTELHQLIISRPVINALIRQSVTSLTLEFGCPDNEYRAFGYKTKDMKDFQYFNVFQYGFGGTAKCEIVIGKDGNIDTNKITDQGLVIDVVYDDFGNADIGAGVRGTKVLTSYALDIGFKKSYNETMPETWFETDLSVAYEEGMWEFTKSGGLSGFVNVLLSPNAISKYIDQGLKGIKVNISCKPDQACAISIFSDKIIGNLQVECEIIFNEEMKTNGFDFEKLYISDLYNVPLYGAKEKCDGFILTVTPLKEIAYEDKTTWFVSGKTGNGNLQIDYTGTDNKWAVTAIDNANNIMSYGSYKMFLNKEIVNNMIKNGTDSIKVSVVAKEGEGMITAWKIPSGVAVYKNNYDQNIIKLNKDNPVEIAFYFRQMSQAEAGVNGFDSIPPCTGYYIDIEEIK